jgi:transposase
MLERTIGIDLAISGAQVAQIFDDGSPHGKPLRFNLTTEALKTFVSAVISNVPSGVPIRAVMEPTGMSWFPVASWLEQAGVTVIRVKGQRVKALRRYLSEHTKSDLADAHLLGTMPRFGGPGFDAVHIPSPAHHALQRLTKQRHRYQDLVCSSRRRLLDLIRWACPALEAILPDTVTRLTLALLAQFFDPSKVRATRRDVLRRFVQNNAAGNHPHSGPFVEELVESLKSTARETLALHEQRVNFELLQLEVRQEVDLLRTFLSHIKELEASSQSLYDELHPSDAIRSIPGIGPTLAPLLVGALANPSRFRNERHIRGFCGMYPATNSSGGMAKPRQRLTKSGSDRVKRALYIAADIARKVDPDLARVYWQLMVHKGHHHKQALCAVANRLVNRIHRVLKTDRPYVLKDLDGNEIGVATAKALVKQRFTVPVEIRNNRRRQPVLVANHV